MVVPDPSDNLPESKSDLSPQARSVQKQSIIPLSLVDWGVLLLIVLFALFFSIY